jgi:Ca2+-binding EF-hand superfamily protein
MKYDKNNDGHIDKEEFKTMDEKEFAGKNGIDKFHEMDTNKDGRISVEEAGIPLPEKLEKRRRLPPPKK